MATRIDRLLRLARGMLQALMVGLAVARGHRRDVPRRGLWRPVVIASVRHGQREVVVVVVVVELGPFVVVDEVLELSGLELELVVDVSVDEGELGVTDPVEDIEALVEVSVEGDVVDEVDPGADVSVDAVVVDGLTATVVVDPGVALAPELL